MDSEDFVKMLASTKKKGWCQQFCYTKGTEGTVDKLKDKLEHPPQGYTQYKSLIAITQFKWEDEDTYDTKTFLVYHKICEDYEIFPGQYASFVDTPFTFIHPRDIGHLACHGDKCRQSVSLSVHGVWCDDCRGDFQAYNFFEMIRGIKFSKIPSEYILHIEEII